MQQRQILRKSILGLLTACLLPIGYVKAERSALADEQTSATRKQAATELENADRAALTALITQQQAVWVRRRSTAAIQAELGRTGADVKEHNTARGEVLATADVLFAPGQSEPTAVAMHELSPLVTFLREQPHRKLRIEDYADASGPASYNLTLSQRRADTIRDFLIANGIAPRRITARGYGEESFVTALTTRTRQRENRRVNVVVLR